MRYYNTFIHEWRNVYVIDLVFGFPNEKVSLWVKIIAKESKKKKHCRIFGLNIE